jgi:DNA polymerase III subunit chi
VKVEFFTGLPDKFDYACRMLRKAQAKGMPVVVTGEPPLLDRLDVALWTFDALSFVPHARLRADAKGDAVHARSGLWLADEAVAATHRQVLINLGPDMAAGWRDFERVIELVGVEPADRDAGRHRWRVYGQTDGVECANNAWSADA